MSKAIVCDKCAKVLPVDGEYRTLEYVFPAVMSCRMFHLCHGCYEDFISWLDAYEGDA